EHASQAPEHSPAASSRQSAARHSAVMPVAATEASSGDATNDGAITDAVIAKLQDAKRSGALRGFDLDVSTDNGDVWLQGRVASRAQKDLVIDAARRVPGVARVVDELTVGGAIQPASAGQPLPISQGSSMPIAQQGAPQATMAPQAFAPSGLAS